MRPPFALISPLRPSGLTWACTWSVMAHGVLLGWLSADINQVHPDRARRVGTLQVSLRQLAPAVKTETDAAAPRPVAKHQAREALTPSSRAPQTATAVPDEVTPPVQPTVANTEPFKPAIPSPEPSGAAFRSLFAPLSSRPFGGQASWRSRQPVQTELSPDMQQQQSLQRTQAQWQESIQRLEQSVSAQPIGADCVIQAELNQKQMVVQCQHTQDQQRILASLPRWQTMDARIRQVPPGLSTYCWHLSGHALTPVPCETAPAYENGNGSPQAAVVLPTH